MPRQTVQLSKTVALITTQLPVMQWGCHTRRTSCRTFVRTYWYFARRWRQEIFFSPSWVRWCAFTTTNLSTTYASSASEPRLYEQTLTPCEGTIIKFINSQWIESVIQNILLSDIQCHWCRKFRAVDRNPQNTDLARYLALGSSVAFFVWPCIHDVLAAILSVGPCPSHLRF